MVDFLANFAAYIITSVDEEARLATMEQIEGEFKSKKKEIESQLASLTEPESTSLYFKLTLPELLSARKCK